jgi:protein translocase SecG subunit
MINIKQYLPILQIIVSILLLIFILLQQSGSAFGGTGGFYTTRRGIHKKIFIATIIFAFLFVLLAFLNLV